jgi:hypothetical protein
MDWHFQMQFESKLINKENKQGNQSLIKETRESIKLRDKN